MTSGRSEPARASPKDSTARPVRVGSALEIAREGDVVLEGKMDHAVGGRSGILQGFEVVESAGAHLGSRRGESSGRRVRASEADDLMAGADKLGDEG